MQVSVCWGVESRRGRREEEGEEGEVLGTVIHIAFIIKISIPVHGPQREFVTQAKNPGAIRTETMKSVWTAY